MTQTETAHLGIDDVRAAAVRIADVVRRTPVERSERLSAEVGLPVWLKLDTEQPTGAFKIRGAANRLLRLTADERARGSQHTGSVTRSPQRCGPARTARSGR